MKNKSIKNVFIMILMSAAILIFMINKDVEAANLEQGDSIKEEKIMRYDARTNETTEVNMEELSKINAIRGNITQLSSYKVNQKKTKLNSDMFKYSRAATTVERITNTDVFPYRATCRTTSKDNKGNTLYGTASIVGANIALTAAHCIFDQNDGMAKLKDWVVYPGYNNGQYYGTVCGWIQVYYSNSWMSNPSNDNDWAICVLGENPGNEVGWYRSSIIWFEF